MQSGSAWMGKVSLILGPDHEEAHLVLTGASSSTRAFTESKVAFGLLSLTVFSSSFQHSEQKRGSTH